MAFSLVLSSRFLLLRTSVRSHATLKYPEVEEAHRDHRVSSRLHKKDVLYPKKNPTAFESSSSTLCCGISQLLFGVTFHLCRHDSGTFESSIILTPLFLFPPLF